jgi:hypothetical protein
MMKWKIAGLTTVMILATSQATAGSLEKQYSHCSAGFKRYELVWEGPWSESDIFMERKCYWRGDWDYEFWIGMLDWNDDYFPATLDYTFRMMAQPSTGPAYSEGQIVTVWQQSCGGSP